jgi:hypothetical protein
MHNRYKMADIENLKNELELLPETERESRQIGLRDAMRVLLPVLREMRERRGYTNDRLLTVLRERGINIGKSTLNDYLRTKRRPGASIRGAGEKGTSEPPPGPDAAETAPAKVRGGAGSETTSVPGPRGPLAAAAPPSEQRSAALPALRAPR